MNIAVIVDNEYDSDIRVRREVKTLQNLGHSIFVLCLGQRKKRYEDHYGIHVERIFIRPKVKDLLFFIVNRFPLYEYLWQKKISKFISKHDIDIIHVHDLYMSRAAHLGRVQSKKDIPLILDLHENYPEAIKTYNWTKGVIREWLSQPYLWKVKEGQYLSYANHLIVLFDQSRYDLVKEHSFLKLEDITAVPNVVDFSKFEKYEVQDVNYETRGTTFFYFGVVAERRGIFDALRALEKVLSEGVDAYLLIIGPVDKADRKNFQVYLERPLLRDHVDYVPWVDLAKLPSYLNLVDVCLAPFLKNKQHDFGIANKLFQYMWGSKPIIASNCTPQEELLNNSMCGLVYSNQSEFVAHMKTLALDAELRQIMGENGRSFLYEKYDNDLFQDLLTRVYRELSR